MPGQLNDILILNEKGDFLSVQVKTHSKPDWGLASCADSLELAIQTEQILACANGEEVQDHLKLKVVAEKLRVVSREAICWSSLELRRKIWTRPFSGSLGLSSTG